MTYYALKIVVSAVLIVAISELAKRSTFAGALLASLPLVSLLAMIWLYAETKNVTEVATLSRSIFWLVLPSLVLLVVLPALLRLGIGFWASLGLSAAATALAYLGAIRLLAAFGIRL